MSAGRILALDIGEKRIGVAIADREVPFPSPLTTIAATEDPKAAVAELIKQRGVTDLVVGMPRNQSGEKTKQSDRIEKIVSLLEIPKHVNLYWQDESLTSVKAEEELKRRKKPHTKADIDALAATYILNDFVESVIQKKTSPNKQSSVDQKSAKPNKKRFGKLIAIIVGLATVFAVGLFIAHSWYQNGLKPRTSDDVFHVITIKPGTVPSQIANQLAEKQLIKNKTAFMWYVKINGVTGMKAGSYRLSSKFSTPDIIKKLEEGKVAEVSVLIAPGMTLDQIVARLEKYDFSKQDIEKALKAVRKHPLLAGVPSDKPIEGYLFPDTYIIGPESTAEQLLTLMLDNFKKQITSQTLTDLSAQNITLPQAVILASIVQKEVSDPGVMPTVAQVFIKRLKEGKELGSDVTYMYAANKSGQAATPNLDSPYNTRRYKGLPPTAIGNFNITALKAVANPSSTDYMFFVAGDDGETYFSHSLAEHEALTRQHCTKLCE